MESDLFFSVTKCPIKDWSKVFKSETSSLPLLGAGPGNWLLLLPHIFSKCSNRL